MNNLLSFRYPILFFLIVGVSKNANSQKVPSYVPNSGLVGWWNLDGDATDASAYKNHGKLYGVTPITDRNGESDKAVYFEGKNQRIEIPDKSSLRCKTISISLWIKNERYGLASLIYKADRSNANFETYSVNNGPSVSIKIKSNCKPWDGWNSSNFRTDNQLNTWTHLAITYDGSVMAHYVNGIKVSESRGNGPIDTCKGGNLHLGYCWDQWPFSFKGRMDELGIWNRALSAEEIMKLFDANSPPVNPQCYWKLPIEGNNESVDTIKICMDSIHKRVFFKLTDSENLKGFTLKVFDAKQNQLFYNKISGKDINGILADASTWGMKPDFISYDAVIEEREEGVGEKMAVEAAPEIIYSSQSEDYFLMVWDTNYNMKEVLKFKLGRP